MKFIAVMPLACIHEVSLRYWLAANVGKILEAVLNNFTLTLPVVELRVQMAASIGTIEALIGFHPVPHHPVLLHTTWKESDVAVTLTETVIFETGLKLN